MDALIHALGGSGTDRAQRGSGGLNPVPGEPGCVEAGGEMRPSNGWGQGCTGTEEDLGIAAYLYKTRLRLRDLLRFRAVGS